MKKVLLFLILLLVPFIVYGAECSNDDIELKNVDLVTTNGHAEVINPAKIVDGKLKFDIKFSTVSDSVDYKVLIKNNSDEEFLIDENSIESNSKNIKYTISFLEDSRVVEPGKEKYVVLRIAYDTKLDDSIFNNDNEYPLDDAMSFSLVNDSKEENNTEVPIYVPDDDNPKNISDEVNQNKQNEDNPITKGSIRLVVIIAVMSLVVIVLAVIGYKKESKALLVLMILSLPLIAKALCTVKIESDSHIVIAKEYIKKCYFDGELVKGAEYEDGQFVYTYLREIAPPSDTLRDMEDEGWSMRLKDKDSTDPIDTEMCVYINDIPVVSMSYAFSRSKAESINTNKLHTGLIRSWFGTFASMAATEIDLSPLDTSNVRTMWGTFANSNFETLDVTTLDTSNVEYMTYMFAETELETLDVSHFDTSKVIDMYEMFFGSKIDNLDLSAWDTSNLENMQWMFYKFEGNINLNGFDTPKVTNMMCTFCGAKTNNLDFSTFDTRKVTNMNSMFGDTKMEIIDVSSFKIDSAETITGLFINTTARVIDISNMTTSTLRMAGNWFDGAENLEVIYGNQDFDSSVLGPHNGAANFGINTKLRGGSGTDCSYVSLDDDVLYMRVDGGLTAPGCFTLKQ